jgi:NAD+--asparagine ADP-ribosyltransferase
LDKIKSDTEKLSSDQTEEDKGKIKDRIMKNMKKFNEMINNYQERVAQEELDDAKENSYTSDKEVTPQLP